MSRFLIRSRCLRRHKILSSDTSVFWIYSFSKYGKNLIMSITISRLRE
uniref:Uncharacterized protein n=1 Tax=Arundo donax TaxID=35708 RepID=A0A0A9C0K9_ARUDO